MNFPPYSVLMSVYYKEKPEWLKVAIESMLNQTIKPAEFVLVKDGKLTDELERVIENIVLINANLFKIVALETNVGLGLALQRGILECSNEFIARMDSDDYSMPNRIERQFLEFEKDDNLLVCGSFENEFIEKPEKIISIHKVPENCEEIYSFMHKRNALLHPTLMYKKSSVIKCGNYANYPFFEDYELFIRMVMQNYKMYNIQEALYCIRIPEDYYKRRGGLRYLRLSFLFMAEYVKKRFFTRKDFIVSFGPRVVFCILPNIIRKILYNKFLRK
jgi:glycosyltransferase involved in cell wall biosynthesis